MFHLLLPDLAARQRFIADLRKADIHAVFHYVPLHSSEMGHRFGRSAAGCPISSDVRNRLVRLPFFTGLRPDVQMEVIERVLAWRC